MNKLNDHLRQYRHNDNPDFVFGYEQKGTEVFVSCLEKEINDLKAMVNALRRAADLYHGGYKVSELEEAASLMIMSPAQCLKSENANAVDEAADCILGVHDGDTCFDILNEIAKKLRKGES